MADQEFRAFDGIRFKGFFVKPLQIIVSRQPPVRVPTDSEARQIFQHEDRFNLPLVIITMRLAEAQHFDEKHVQPVFELPRFSRDQCAPEDILKAITVFSSGMSSRASAKAAAQRRASSAMIVSPRQQSYSVSSQASQQWSAQSRGAPVPSGCHPYRRPSRKAWWNNSGWISWCSLERVSIMSGNVSKTTRTNSVRHVRAAVENKSIQNLHVTGIAPYRLTAKYLRVILSSCPTTLASQSRSGDAGRRGGGSRRSGTRVHWLR